MKNTKRSRGALKGLNKFGTDTVGRKAMSQQGRSAARHRSAADRSRSARRAAATRKKA